MALSDRQIERYSRQIILPEVGGRGQARLLAAVMTLAGSGTLAATAARYLAGAGVGELRLAGAGDDRLASELRALNPELTVRAGHVDANTAVLITADLGIEALDARVREARDLGVPVVAAAAQGAGGWLFIGGSHQNCAGCAARSAHWSDAGDALAPLAPIAAGVLGSLVALAALALALGLPDTVPPLRWFAATTGELTAMVPTRVPGCAACPR
jgi:molybdopterin/thiamine biosynthesis adenylyltransferase